MTDDPDPNGDPKPAAPPGRLRPTIIAPPSKGRRAKADRGGAQGPGAAGPPASTPIVRAPTAIPGVQRRRVAVRAADLVRLSPGAAPQAAARAVRLIDGFVVEGAREPHVDAWGQAAEQRHEALVQEALDLAQAQALSRARGPVDGIIVLLAAIDIETICADTRSPLLALLEPAGGRIDTPRKLTTARAELERLAGRARAALDPLADLKASLDDHARRVDETSLELEAAALAALFLAERLAPERPELSRRFLQREMSLTKTALRIRGGQLARADQVQEPLALIATIREVVLRDLSDWLVAVAALAGSREARRRLLPTEVAELRHRLGALLRNLQA